MTRVLVDPAVTDSWCGPAGRRRSRSARPRALLLIRFAAAFCVFGIRVASEAAEPIGPDSRAYAERIDAVDLARARQAFVSGDVVEGVSHVRRLLDRPYDSFVPGEGRVSGARTAVEELLRRQPAGIRQFYESAETAAASAALRLAEEGQDVAALRQVAVRFPTTEAGFRAADRLAAAAFDEGDFATAARLWEGVLADPRNGKRLSAPAVARLLTALRLAGRDGRASELAVRFAGMPLRLEGQPASVGSLLGGVTAAAGSLPATAEPATAGLGLSAPAFPPLWEAGTSAEPNPLLELWASNRRAEARPLAAPAGAVWTPRGIIVREPSGIAAIDVETGERLWALGARSEDGSAGDAHDLTRFEGDYASGGVYGRLTADADRVYLTERVADPPPAEVRTASHVPVPVYNQVPGGDRVNRLSAIALAPPPDGQRPAWSVGGLQEQGGPLAEHYFFGPPCVTANGLLVLAEHRQCLVLIALDPATGDVFWQQPLGYVPRPVSADAERATAACPPTVSDGIAVCGTNAGFLVAFDYAVGRLLWAYDYASADADPRQAQDGPSDRPCYYGDTSFPCPVVIRGDHVLLMPHDSRHVHCIDLRTGFPRWKALREDGLYIACVTDSSALVVGRSLCRALSMAGGSPLWSARFGVPGGTGVATDTAYLLPLEDGRVVAIDLARGCRVGFDLPRAADRFRSLGDERPDLVYSDRWRPGNLYTDGRTLLSVGPSGVTRLRTAGEMSRVADVTTAPLDLARVELAAGRWEAARPRLEALTVAAPSPEDREEARVLLRELHYLRLQGEPATGGGEALAELDRLSVTPAERGRFLLRAAERDLASDDVTSLLRRAGELAGLTLPGALPSPQDPTLLVTSASWVPALVRRCPERGALEWERSVLASCPAAELHRRLAFLPEGLEADAVRLELARRAAAEGEWQRAELLLLQNLEDGLCVESCRELDELRHRAGLIDVAAVRRRGPSRRIGGVQVAGRLWSPADDGVCRTYGGMRRGFPTRGRDPLRIVDRGDSRQSRLAVVDLAGGVCLGEVTVDSRLRFPLLNRQPANGHFVPVASVGRIHGLSLLETHRGEPVWTADLPGSDGVLPQVGPYGPSFCTIQTRRELTTFDPTNGTVLWQRRELPPDRGLHGDQAAGLFGDGQMLTMLDGDGTAYTVYRTRTGEQYGSGTLPMDRQRQRRAYGRKLFFIESGDDDHSTARLWDPLTNSYELAIEFEGRLLQTSTREDELVLLFADGRLLVYDTAAAAVVIDVRLSPFDVAPAHTLWVFADADRYYVSLYHADPRRFEEPKVASFIYDTPLSAAHVQGRLLAIDRRTGETLWSRATDQRTVIDPIDHPTPFLVAVARVSDRRFGNRKTLLVEAIDKETGATLGFNDALVADQPLQIRSDEGRVELAGMASTVVLDFRPERDEAVALAAP